MTFWISLGLCGFGLSGPPYEFELILLTVGCGWGRWLTSYRDALKVARDALKAAQDEIARLRGEKP
jgi:hypothetical protein